MKFPGHIRIIAGGILLAAMALVCLPAIRRSRPALFCSAGQKIIDTSAAPARSGLTYTCRCGWVDWGHARPDAAAVLWAQISRDSGQISKDGAGFQLRFSETNNDWFMPEAAGVSRTYYVKRGLSRAEKEGVALTIFTEVSVAFEQFQHDRYEPYSHSGFSTEDLVSDLIGFYRAVRPETDYRRICRPVSGASSEAVGRKYGKPGAAADENRTFNAFLAPCGECDSLLQPAAHAELPAALRAIQPAIKGDLFRDWRPDSD